MRRLAHARVQRRRARAPRQSQRPRPHARFAGIAAVVAALSARSLVLDGEVAIYDQELRTRFDWLRESDPEAIATPPVLIAYPCFPLPSGAENCLVFSLATRSSKEDVWMILLNWLR